MHAAVWDRRWIMMHMKIEYLMRDQAKHHQPLVGTERTDPSWPVWVIRQFWYRASGRRAIVREGPRRYTRHTLDLKLLDARAGAAKWRCDRDWRTGIKTGNFRDASIEERLAELPGPWKSRTERDLATLRTRIQDTLDGE